MQYFEVILEKGHLGAGNGYEVKRYFIAKDAVSLISKIKRLPRLKKRDTIKSIKFMRLITRDEYIKGRISEYFDPYMNKMFKGIYICPVCGKRFKDLISFKGHIMAYKELVGAAV